MDVGAISLLLIVLAIVVIYVVYPFTRRWRVNLQGARGVSALLAERERTLKAIQELDFDHGIGKVPENEYSSHNFSFKPDSVLSMSL
jgi:hypothetical protein